MIQSAMISVYRVRGYLRAIPRGLCTTDIDPKDLVEVRDIAETAVCKKDLTSALGYSSPIKAKHA